MSNKIQIIGKITSLEVKNNENVLIPTLIFFSLLVPSPAGSLTIIRCSVHGEKSLQVQEELQKDDIVKVNGYLRNEKHPGRQIVVKVTSFEKILNLTRVEDINPENSNRLRLIGKVRTKEIREENLLMLIFRLEILRDNNEPQLFFCRINGNFVDQAKETIQKGDFLDLRGFLQTKKIKPYEAGSENKNKPELSSILTTNVLIKRVSTIIVTSFIKLGNDDPSNFEEEIDYVPRRANIARIDFTKPKQ